MVDHKKHPSPAPVSGQPAVGENAEPARARPAGASGAFGGGERVAKALARAGIASRREVERLIGEGRVALNGAVLTTPAVKVGPNDILTVNGQVVGDKEPTRLWRYHKPVGLLTAHADPKGRPVVFDHLPEGLPRVISVGRLDMASEGLLLLTNDGELARALELPSSGWVRRYRARAYGHVSQEKLDKLAAGVTVEGVVYGAIEAKIDKVKHAAADEDRKGPANIWLTVAITEGKNREIRRVLEHVGLKVNRLIRLAYGPFALNTLPQGAAEEVGPRVIREQLEGLIPPQNMPPAAGRTTGILLPKGQSHLPPRPDRAAQRRAPAEEAPKKEYKPGWAKAKKKLSPHGPPTKRKPMADAPRKGVTDLTFGRPTAQEARESRVKTARTAERTPRVKPGPGKPGLPKPAAGKAARDTGLIKPAGPRGSGRPRGR